MSPMDEQKRSELEDVAYDLVLAHLESFEYLTVAEELADTGDASDENIDFVYKQVIGTLKELEGYL